MMRNRHLSPTAKHILSSLRDEAVDRFDARLLCDGLHDHVGEDDQLLALANAVAEAQHARDVREREFDGEDNGIIGDCCESAEDQLHETLGHRLVEVIAEECRTILLEGDDWREEGWADQRDVAEAQLEAARHLNARPELCRRLWGTTTPAANHTAHAGP